MGNKNFCENCAAEIGARKYRLTWHEILCLDVLMSDTTHISIRIPKEILAYVDAQAEYLRWSRNATLNTCIEFGLVDLEKERGTRTATAAARVGQMSSVQVNRVAEKIAAGTARASGYEKRINDAPLIGPCSECGALGGVHQKGCKR